MTHPIELIAYTVAILVAIAFSLWIASLWLDRSDDRAAGVLIGQIAPIAPAPEPWPAKHFLAACMYCHHVTRSDSQPVRVGDELRVSHGICPACSASKYAELTAPVRLHAHA